MDWVLTNHSRKIIAQRRTGYKMKRLLDIMICIVAFPVALPIMLFCSMLIRLTSRGPALFKQVRIGQNGESFTIYKFRTMCHNLDDSKHRAFMRAYVSGQISESKTSAAGNWHKDLGLAGQIDESETSTADTVAAESDVATPTKISGPGWLSRILPHRKSKTRQIFKPFDSSQITRVGRILRKTSLDELPQLWNVVKGDMSIVGPRPNVQWEVEEYTGNHHKRLDVLPGITGLAQVRGRSSISFADIVANDLEYIEKQSLLMDVKILWWTVTSMMTGKGAG